LILNYQTRILELRNHFQISSTKLKDKLIIKKIQKFLFTNLIKVNQGRITAKINPATG